MRVCVPAPPRVSACLCVPVLPAGAGLPVPQGPLPEASQQQQLGEDEEAGEDALEADEARPAAAVSNSAPSVPSLASITDE